MLLVENETDTESSIGEDEESQWMKTLEEEDRLLREELVEYGDILMVDVVDVYRNIPAKLKAAYEWWLQDGSTKFC